MGINMKEFEGRTAVITGAMGGLGRSFARRLKEGGAKLVLWDLSASKLEHTAPPELETAIRMDVDVTDESSVDAAFRRTIDQVQSVDILINNAGILGAQAPLESFDIAVWRKVFDVNVAGTVIVSKPFMSHMREKNYGRIINISSIAGKEGLPGSGAYGASKATIIWLTKLMGRELAETDVTVTCISPASIDTGDLGMAVEVGPELLAQMASRIPKQRLARAEEVANLVAWLCSEECSYSTGATFDISGGRAFF